MSDFQGHSPDRYPQPDGSGQGPTTPLRLKGQEETPETQGDLSAARCSVVLGARSPILSPGTATAPRETLSLFSHHGEWLPRTREQPLE